MNTTEIEMTKMPALSFLAFTNTFFNAFNLGRYQGGTIFDEEYKNG